MGYELKPRTATFSFEEGSYAGLEVELRINPEMADLWRIGETDRTAWSSPAKARAFLIDFASVVLVGWNLTFHGEPVPATPENFADKLDMAVARGLVGGVMRQIGELSGPLALTSRNGSTSKVLQASTSRSRSRKRS